MIFPLTSKIFPSFWPTKKPMAFSDTYFEMGIAIEGGTKNWFVNRYFDGWDELIANWKKAPKLNPITLGDDYNLQIVVKNPTELYEIPYKQIKYFASDIFYEGLDANDPEERAVSFWFVKKTDTRYVDEDVVVTFTLAMDYMHTCADTIENAVGDWKVDQMHEQEWIMVDAKKNNENLQDKRIIIPNTKIARGSLNCGDYCKNRNKKFLIDETDLKLNEKLEDVALIYCTFPQVDANKIPKWGREQTLLRVVDTIDTSQVIAIPFMIVIVREPDVEDLVSQKSTVLQEILIYITKNGGTVHNVERTELDVESNLKNGNLQNIKRNGNLNWYNVFIFKTLGIDDTAHTPIIEYEMVVNKKTINIKDGTFFHLNNKDLISDELKENQIPHLNIANHTENLVSIPEKKSYLFDIYNLFNGGNPFYVNENGDIVLNSMWVQIYDGENGGKLIYFENTLSDLKTSLANSSNLLDYSGGNNFPYAIDSYWTAMQTRKNQKQATLDNINIDKRTGEQLNKWETEENSVSTVTGFFKHVGSAIGNGLTGNLGGAISEGVGAFTGAVDDINRTIVDNKKNSIQIKANYDKAMNSYNAEYDDLKMGSANQNLVGKINSQSVLQKEKLSRSKIEEFNKSIYDLIFYRNEISNVAKEQIMFNRNKYGNPVNYYLKNKPFKELLTHKRWNYVKIANFFEYAKKTGLPNEIIEVLSDQIANGIIILNLNSIWGDNIVELDYNKNNYHLSYEDFDTFVGDIKILQSLPSYICLVQNIYDSRDETEEEDNKLKVDVSYDYNADRCLVIIEYNNAIKGNGERKHFEIDFIDEEQNTDENWKKVDEDDIENDQYGCLTLGDWINPSMNFVCSYKIGIKIGTIEE